MLELGEEWHYCFGLAIASSSAGSSYIIKSRYKAHRINKNEKAQERRRHANIANATLIETGEERKIFGFEKRNI